ncbi:MAG: bifunctional methylenetetrahydrofolate dehydrogenase/methenyltetrahydrofolate cyclohydrolase [Gammaproteobacteria bacterium RIFCSPHIGHO2_12_FULL_41_20]|nr:MAG: bifunctional methylenetetrahydrofolate dehydrogenase/methenyltetrahydrofolate cyclohydrolase [Gammaproteobacteria bacterium RIFCSPHIGHO2_12_FULL_41_20]
MVAQCIDGKSIAAQLRSEIAAIISSKCQQGYRPPGLAVILVGNDPASHIYVRNKRQACAEVGVISFYHVLPASISETELVTLIHMLNIDNSVDGVLLQLPLPSHLNTGTIIDSINPAKDVDGFHPYNLGRLAQRRPALRSCTPYGVMYLLDHIGQAYKGKHAVIVGASNIVGRPMSLELLLAGATVTICHRFTRNLAHYVQQADILVSAVGKPGLIKAEWIKPGATVIDIGINRLADGTLTGDIEFEKAKTRAAWITPVPGGVGPMTVAMLLKNTLIAAGYSPTLSP